MTMNALIETRNWRAFHNDVDSGLEQARREEVVRRLWRKDHTLWKSEDREISNRLGWLEAPENAERDLERWKRIALEARDQGFERALLLGMGGSSLAPEVFSRVFGPADGALELLVLDSTVPETVNRVRESLDPEKTLVLVSSKSGTTLETLTLFGLFHDWLGRRLGPGRAGDRFLAVTDPGTPLEQTALRLGFRAVLAGDPDIGGRFSVFSVFGLFPAALLGLDTGRFLERAREMSRLCRREDEPAANPGLFLGTALGRLACRGVDKLMLLLSPEIESFGGWLEQLIAESTGKEGRGILPVIGEPPGAFNLGRRDRLWTVVKLAQDRSLEAPLARIEESGSPCLVLNLEDPADLAGQFFLWETAAAVAGWALKINPFDQPDVAAAKENTEDMLARHRSRGGFPEEGGFPDESRAAAAVCSLADGGREGDYLCLQAFLDPRPEIAGLLAEMAQVLRLRSRLSVTVGFGPRYLHSTGQLHKGDAGRGLFIQITARDGPDILLPQDAAERGRGDLSLGLIKEAQALGDYVALGKKGRRVIRLRLAENPSLGLRKILKELKA